METSVKAIMEECELIEKHLKSAVKRVKDPERKAQIQKQIEGFKQSREELQEALDS